MVTPDPFAQRVLTYLGDRYLPVHSEWVEAADIARALRVETDVVDAQMLMLEELALIELASPDDENPSFAAIITTKGLLSIGRSP